MTSQAILRIAYLMVMETLVISHDGHDFYNSVTNIMKDFAKTPPTTPLTIEMLTDHRSIFKRSESI
jgi:hypothetical protein